MLWHLRRHPVPRRRSLMELRLHEDLLRLQEEARLLAERFTAEPGQVLEDSWMVGRSAELARELAERGWLGLTWPISCGGAGRPAIERFVIFEALISAGAPVASCWFADRQIGPTLIEFGSAEQQQRWLPGILQGRELWCIGMSEPDAGSDVASLRTRAWRQGGSWVIEGRKIWTSGAAEADWCYLIARTDPSAPPHQGLSELVVEMGSPGVGVRRITDAVGDRHFCEVTFDGVVVPEDHLVGRENGSFRQVMRQMEHERGGVDRLVSNLALYREILALADRSDPLLRQEIAAIESGYRIGRLLVLREVLGQAPAGYSAATKTFCTEHEQRVASFCTRVLGARAAASLGWLSDPLAARVARNACYASAYTIMGGTTQILRNILAERVLGLPRGPR